MAILVRLRLIWARLSRLRLGLGHKMGSFHLWLIHHFRSDAKNNPSVNLRHCGAFLPHHGDLHDLQGPESDVARARPGLEPEPVAAGLGLHRRLLLPPHHVGLCRPEADPWAGVLRHEDPDQQLPVLHLRADDHHLVQRQHPRLRRAAHPGEAADSVKTFEPGLSRCFKSMSKAKGVPNH